MIATEEPVAVIYLGWQQPQKFCVLGASGLLSLKIASKL
jgi:hypothetical protein